MIIDSPTNERKIFSVKTMTVHNVITKRRLELLLQISLASLNNYLLTQNHFKHVSRLQLNLRL